MLVGVCDRTRRSSGAEVALPSRRPTAATLRCAAGLPTALVVRISPSGATVRRGIEDTCPGGGLVDVHGYVPGRHRQPRPGRQERPRLRSVATPPRTYSPR
jgi:hypothetical protein